MNLLNILKHVFRLFETSVANCRINRSGIYLSLIIQCNNSLVNHWETSHRFCEGQHQLEKFLPGIHYTKDGKGLELIYAFTIKLKSEIQRELVSREFKFTSLEDVIKAAQRYEVHSAHSQVHSVMDSDHNKQWKPAALLHDMTKQRVYNPPSSLQSTDTNIEPPRPFSRPRAKSDFHSKPKSNVNTKTATEICFAYNKRPKAYCELPSNECKYGRQHKCQTCNMWGCKRINHRVPEPQAHVANTNSDQCSINSTDSTVN